MRGLRGGASGLWCSTRLQPPLRAGVMGGGTDRSTHRHCPARTAHTASVCACVGRGPGRPRLPAPWHVLNPLGFLWGCVLDSTGTICSTNACQKTFKKNNTLRLLGVFGHQAGATGRLVAGLGRLAGGRLLVLVWGVDVGNWVQLCARGLGGEVQLLPLHMTGCFFTWVGACAQWRHTLRWGFAAGGASGRLQQRLTGDGCAWCE